MVLKARAVGGLSMLCMSVLLIARCGDGQPPIIVDDDRDNDLVEDESYDGYNSGDDAVALCGLGDVTITGRVFEPGGQPLEGARVHVGNYEGWYDYDDEFSGRCSGAITGSDGSFELFGVNRDEELLRAALYVDPGAPSFRQYEAIVDIDVSEVDELEVELHTVVSRRASCGDDSGASLHGVVYHDENTTLPLARVVLLQDEGCGSVAGTGGIYHLENIPAGTYHIVFTQRRWRGMEAITLEAGEERQLDLNIPAD